MALGDEFRLAEHEFDFAFGNAGHPLFDVDEFLGRHRKKDKLTGELVSSFGIAEPDRSAEHPRDLGVVAAAMRCPSGRIGEWVLRGAQTVEFADKGETRARRMSGEPALDTG